MSSKEASIKPGQDEEAHNENERTRSSSTTSTQPSTRESNIEKDQPQESDLSRGLSNIEKGLPAFVPVPEDTSEPKEPLSDPDIVDWETSDDPKKALNWPVRKKWTNIAVISSITFLTPLASSMLAPAIPSVMQEFNSTNQTIGSFIISVYVLGYALGPLIIAPLSELYGRLVVYHTNNVLFIVFTIACAVAPNIGSLIFFRLMAGCAGSAPLTIGGGSIADLFKQEERGGAMAIFALGPIMGPTIGPVAGGYLAEAKGWRWIFWVITMAVGLSLGSKGCT